jgi:hypothetical protein
MVMIADQWTMVTAARIMATEVTDEAGGHDLVGVRLVGDLRHLAHPPLDEDDLGQRTTWTKVRYAPCFDGSSLTQLFPWLRSNRHDSTSSSENQSLGVARWPDQRAGSPYCCSIRDGQLPLWYTSA